MLWARDQKGDTFFSCDKKTTYQNRGYYLCPDCSDEVFFKHSRIITSCFSHYPGSHKCDYESKKNNDAHNKMVKDLYNFFKNLSWVKELSFRPILHESGKLYPDLIITTNKNDEIAIEAANSRLTRPYFLEKIKKYSDKGINVLYIFNYENYNTDFLEEKTTPIISPNFNATNNIIIRKFYIWNPDGTLSVLSQIYYKGIEYHLIGYFLDKCNFSDYHIGDIDGYRTIADNCKLDFEKILSGINFKNIISEESKKTTIFYENYENKKCNRSGFDIDDKLPLPEIGETITVIPITIPEEKILSNGTHIFYIKVKYGNNTYNWNLCKSAYWGIRKECKKLGISLDEDCRSIIDTHILITGKEYKDGKIYDIKFDDYNFNKKEENVYVF